MAERLGEAILELKTRDRGLTQGIGRARAQAEALNTRFKRVGANLTAVGRRMSLAITAPIVGFATLTLRAAGNFEQAMNKVAAVSGATGDELGTLSDLAKELGATTQFSASQAADAMGFLAQAGFKVQEILSALPGTLQLAASAQIELGRAADIVSNVLSGYGFQVEELARVNDVLVKTFTSANTDLEQLGEAMKMAGPVARSAGAEFEEVTALLGLFGQAGIQASMAGTSLRAAIARILNPAEDMREAMASAGLSFTDARGRMLPLVDIIRQLEPFAEDAGLMMQLFGLRAGPAMAAAVSQGADALADLTRKLKDSGGTAARISAAQMQGLNGAMRELKSAFEALQIAIAESGLIKFATEFARGLADWIRGLSNTGRKLLFWSTVIAGVTAVLGPAIAGLGLLAVGLNFLLPVLATVGAALAGMIAASGPIGLFIIAVGLIAAAWRTWGDDVVRIVAATVGAIREWLVNKLSAVFDFVGEKIAAVTGFFRDMWEKVAGNSFVPDMVNEIARQFARLGEVMVSPAEEAARVVSSAFRGMEDALVDFVTKGKVDFKSLVNSILADIARIAIRQSITGPLAAGLSRALGGLFGVATGPPRNILPGLAHGGSFTVGGSSGIDRNLVAFRATAGERVTVTPPGRGGAAPSSSSVTINMFNDFSDVDPANAARIDSKLAIMKNLAVAEAVQAVSQKHRNTPGFLRAR